MKMRVSEIRVKRIRVNQGLGVCIKIKIGLKHARVYSQFLQYLKCMTLA